MTCHPELYCNVCVSENMKECMKEGVEASQGKREWRRCKGSGLPCMYVLIDID
eukprot:m.289746 g.289746  ORF g.289746 m.289746 type:complete len:53 (+) comp206812_c0_seq1:78-236(+)